LRVVGVEDRMPAKEANQAHFQEDLVERKESVETDRAIGPPGFMVTMTQCLYTKVLVVAKVFKMQMLEDVEEVTFGFKPQIFSWTKALR